MNSDAATLVNTFLTVVDARQLREDVIDLRAATLRSIALCRDILDRLEPQPEHAEVTDARR
jgi:hypothetical protein